MHSAWARAWSASARRSGTVVTLAGLPLGYLRIGSGFRPGCARSRPWPCRCIPRRRCWPYRNCRRPRIQLAGESPVRGAAAGRGDEPGGVAAEPPHSGIARPDPGTGPPARRDRAEELTQSQEELLAQKEELPDAAGASLTAQRQELKVSEERSRLILESSAEGIFGTDIEGGITFVNPAACRMLGFSAEELIGQPSHAAFTITIRTAASIRRKSAHVRSLQAGQGQPN